MARTIRPPGSRFDPDKVLLDPYARAVFFPPGFDREAAKWPGSNAGQAPLGVLGPAGAAPVDWGGAGRATRRTPSSTRCTSAASRGAPTPA